jgi:hypothetical protein
VASGSVNLTSGKESKVSTENFTIPLTATAGTKYCRYISFSPHDEGGGSGSGSQVCVTVVAAFELHPYVDSDVSVVDPGGKITFTYTVHNADPTASGSVTCKPVGNTRGAGYTPLPEQDVDRTSDAGYAPPATSCPRTFAGGSSVDVATETFTVGAVPPGNSVCRSLVINPKNASGGFRASAEACVVVAAKPYVKIFGGDMSAGNQQTVNGACSAADGTDDGSILSWNLGAASSYAGAGAQYAALALGQITDFSSTQDNAAGSAPEPSGLAFSNQNIAAGTFGGNFGSLPCVPDYYSLKPATTAPLDSNLSNLSTSGAYSATGPISIGGNINPNNRIQAYVDGDVYITGDINYPGSWSIDHSPMFELVVQGNIYIDKNVQNLQGIFIAQPDAAGAGGTIYTCATSAAPIDTDSPTYYGDCKNKLTISGAFSANQIQLLRTHGTVADSTTDSALAATSNAAEQFSYNPLAWLAQPQTSSGTATAGNYDAITTLPPIL